MTELEANGLDVDAVLQELETADVGDTIESLPSGPLSPDIFAEVEQA